MALFLIGLGIYGIEGMPYKLKRVATSCKTLYLEDYTAYVPNKLIDLLSGELNKPIIRVGRPFLEDGDELLRQAKQDDVVLLVYGDPLIATTHLQLILRALAQGVRVKVMHNSSILNLAYGGLGLQPYRFGRFVTLTRSLAPPLTAYMVLHTNLANNLHTLMLLEYAPGTDILTPAECLNLLQKAEEQLGLGIINADLFVIALCGYEEETQIKAGTLGELAKMRFGLGQYSLIIPARLHFMEEEAIKRLCGYDAPIPDNTQRVVPVWRKILEPRLAEVRQALTRLYEQKGSRGVYTLLEKAQTYYDDIDRYIKEGRAELAILTLGRLEGLLESHSSHLKVSS